MCVNLSAFSYPSVYVRVSYPMCVNLSAFSYPSVYVRVSYYMPWITQTIASMG